ncbi:MAG: hypothetical protein Q4E22_06965 [Coriobacteriia bacterium]|nr:hypothetical protein [Coriobacteriia bacterium]
MYDNDDYDMIEDECIFRLCCDISHIERQRTQNLEDSRLYRRL